MHLNLYLLDCNCLCGSFNNWFFHISNFEKSKVTLSTKPSIHFLALCDEHDQN